MPSDAANAILATPIGELTAPHPLADADPNSITALFEADPSVLPDANLDRLIAELRTRAESHAAEEIAKANKPKAAAPKVSAAAKIDPKLQVLRADPSKLAIDDLFN